MKNDSITKLLLLLLVVSLFFIGYQIDSSFGKIKPSEKYTYIITNGNLVAIDKASGKVYYFIMEKDEWSTSIEYIKYHDSNVYQTIQLPF